MCPIMADEALHGTSDAHSISRRAALPTCLRMKIAQAGGLYDAAKMAAIADAAGIGLYGGTMLEGGVGTAAVGPGVLDTFKAGVGHRIVRPAASH